MSDINKFNENEIIEVAQKMGYDPEKPEDLKNFKAVISKMDTWDISKILFFGKGFFMRDIMEWLLKNERAAREIYEAAAIFFQEDSHFSQFLNSLAEDEALHVRIVETALNIFQIKEVPIEAGILLDLNTRSRIDRHIAHIQKIIETGNLNKKAMIEYVIHAEYSEWNNLFLYVVNTLKNENPDFSTVGPKLQHHLRRIDRYMESTGDKTELIHPFLALKAVWNEKILIVDDAPAITDLLSELLSGVGKVETAPDGAAALNKALDQYYAVIISDISMPIMDGIAFFMNLESSHQNVAERFIFMTGFPKPDVVNFCRIKKIPLLIKPFGLNEMNDYVYKVLENNLRRKPLQ